MPATSCCWCFFFFSECILRLGCHCYGRLLAAAEIILCFPNAGKTLNTRDTTAPLTQYRSLWVLRAHCTRHDTYTIFVVYSFISGNSVCITKQPGIGFASTVYNMCIYAEMKMDETIYRSFETWRYWLFCVEN